MLCANVVIKQNCVTLKLKTRPKLLFGYIPLDIALPSKA
jgi:hypothetical protein